MTTLQVGLQPNLDENNIKFKKKKNLEEEKTNTSLFICLTINYTCIVILDALSGLNMKMEVSTAIWRSSNWKDASERAAEKSDATRSLISS